ISKVILNWAKVYGKEYKLEISDTEDGPWTECAYVADNPGAGLITHEFPPQTGRHVRMYGMTSSGGGFSLYEMAVYGEAVVAVETRPENEIGQPDLPNLEQNYPNPFNSATVINYFLPHSAPARLTIFNLAGQKVATLADGMHQAGMHSIQWHAENQTSGLYFYQLETDDLKVVKKLLLQR
ncbi:MAG: T9SS C-terminal target domain-containing protein, partial [Calditrichaeota bacterium]